MYKIVRLLIIALIGLIPLQSFARDKIWPVRFGFDDAGGPAFLETKPWFGNMIDEIGFDLWVMHLRPQPSIEKNIRHFQRMDERCGKLGIKWVCNHEAANWGKTFVDEKGRDWFNREDGRHFELLPPELLKALSQCKHFLGVMYDEPAHMQNARNLIANKGKPWKPYMYNTDGRRLIDAAEEFTQAVRDIADIYAKYNIPLYTENVFPVLYHGFARGGFTPGTKILKESLSPMFIACTMGAAIQYDTELWICLDLWGINGYPGHTPEEYRSALLLAYHMGADYMYTENIAFDNKNKGLGSLILITSDGYKITEHGRITKWFANEYIPKHPRRYTFRQVKPRVAIVRQPDACWGQGRSGFPILPDQLFGNAKWKSNQNTEAWFKIWHLLTRGAAPKDGFSYWCDCLNKKPYQVFYPLDGVVVFDHHVGYKHLKGVQVIFLTGLGISPQTLKAVEQCVSDGVTCIALPHLVPKRVAGQTGSNGTLTDGRGRWVVTEDFLADRVREQMQHVIPSEDIIRYRFGQYLVTMKPVGSDMNKITANVERVKAATTIPAH